MSLANNHANDFGDSGRIETMNILDSLGIKHSGPIGDIAVFDISNNAICPPYLECMEYIGIQEQ